MREGVKDFIKTLRNAGSYHSERQAFEAFLEFSYTALAQRAPFATPERREKLEERYMAEVGRWKPEAVREVFPKLLALTMTNIVHGDFLGTVAGETNALAPELGQFFTPFEVCRMMASLTIDPEWMAGQVREKGYVSLMEPACGAGAMLLAQAAVLRDSGQDVAKVLYAEATDVSYTAFRMCYIQLACAGIPAKVTHGNALTLEVFEEAYTPVIATFYTHQDRLARQRDAVRSVRRRVRA